MASCAMPVERHLLHVEIAVEQKAAAVYDHERHKDDKGQSEAEKEGEEEIIAARLLLDATIAHIRF